jgi:SAM-dependent methyltransferase
MLNRIAAWRHQRLERLAVRLHARRKELEPGYRHFYEDFQAQLETADARGQVWLDAGCGQNGFVREQGRNFRYALGCDRDQRLRAGAGRPFVIADVRRLPFKSGSVHLVTSYMVVEHWTAPEAVLREIGRVLQSGGRLVCCTVNRDFWGSRLNRSLAGSVKKLLLGLLLGQPAEEVYPAYYRLNTRADIVTGLQQAGYRNITVREYIAYCVFSTIAFRLNYLLHRRTPLGAWRGMVSNLLWEATVDTAAGAGPQPAPLRRA